MSFDFSTLITDRSAEDLAKKATKAFYNISDLNRVTACMDYLDGELRRLGYESGYQRVRIERPEPPHASRLPEGYTELEYIESTGTQYIDTGFKPNNNTRVVMDAEYTNVSGSNPTLFGARTAATSKNYAILYVGSIRSDYNNVYTNTWSIIPTNRYEYDKNKELTTIAGDTKSYTNIAFQCDFNLFLFGLNQGGKVQWNSAVKGYSCRVYDNDALILDFVPSKNPSGAVGLYDLVGKKFYGNSGTGVFLAGPDVSQEPQPDPLDPYLWYDTDAPTASQMAQYLANVAALRAVFTLPEGTPQTPQSMALLTFTRANDIERVLQGVESALERMALTFAACGTATVGGDYL